MYDKIALTYCAAFSRKDIDALRELFSPQVTLRDWEIDVAGIPAVLAANARIFAGVSSIAVEPLHIYRDGNTVLAELQITLNEKETIKVIDLLEFDASGKICAIRAFKG